MKLPLGTAPLSPGAAGAAHGAASPPAGGPRNIAAPPAKTAVPMRAPLSGEAVRKVAQQINDFLKSSSSSLQFAVDGDTHKVVVRIVDSRTNELIRQMPSEEMIAISKSLDRMSGLLLRQKA